MSGRLRRGRIGLRISCPEFKREEKKGRRLSASCSAQLSPFRVQAHVHVQVGFPSTGTFANRQLYRHTRVQSKQKILRDCVVVFGCIVVRCEL